MYNFLDRVEEVKKDLNTSAFARVLGMGQKTVDFYLKGERKPSVEFVVNICSKFGVSADWLLGLPDHGNTGIATATGSHAIAVSGHNTTVNAGSDCSKCKLMQAHLKEITGH